MCLVGSDWPMGSNIVSLSDNVENKRVGFLIKALEFYFKK